MRFCFMPSNLKRCKIRCEAALSDCVAESKTGRSDVGVCPRPETPFGGSPI
jgi:hypothetical protein